MGLNSVHWFRKGLRLHDNSALQRALSGADTVRCVYILDPCFAGSSTVRIHWWRFLIQCLEDLDTSLRKLKSRLFVVRGQLADVFPRLFKEWNVTQLTFEYASEPFGKERDAAIMKLAKIAGVEVVVQISHTCMMSTGLQVMVLSLTDDNQGSSSAQSIAHSNSTEWEMSINTVMISFHGSNSTGYNCVLQDFKKKNCVII